MLHKRILSAAIALLFIVPISHAQVSASTPPSEEDVDVAMRKYNAIEKDFRQKIKEGIEAEDFILPTIFGTAVGIATYFYTSFRKKDLIEFHYPYISNKLKTSIENFPKLSRTTSVDLEKGLLSQETVTALRKLDATYVRFIDDVFAVTSTQPLTEMLQNQDAVFQNFKTRILAIQKGEGLKLLTAKGNEIAHAILHTQEIETLYSGIAENTELYFKNENPEKLSEMKLQLEELVTKMRSLRGELQKFNDVLFKYNLLTAETVKIFSINYKTPKGQTKLKAAYEMLCKTLQTLEPTDRNLANRIQRKSQLLKPAIAKINPLLEELALTMPEVAPKVTQSFKTILSRVVQLEIKKIGTFPKISEFALIRGGNWKKTLLATVVVAGTVLAIDLLGTPGDAIETEYGRLPSSFIEENVNTKRSILKKHPEVLATINDIFDGLNLELSNEL